MAPESRQSGESPATIKASLSARALQNGASSKAIDPGQVIVAGTRRPLEELFTALRKVHAPLLGGICCVAAPA